jgi:tetratricopeptide (TPR) repeat protein
VAIDRAVTLRNAEKLIRQGKLDAAITEFLRLLEETPHDWNLRNTIGDLYARAGQVDKAVEQFMEIANSLSDEGSVAKAGAIYKKILKVKPNHEHALVQIADILGSQGLYADARAHLKTLIDLRLGKGDSRGAIHAKIRLGSLDPEDYESRLTAAAARIELGDVGGAMNDYKKISKELAGKGRQDEAVAVLRDAAKLNPNDEDVRERLFDVYFTQGDMTRARECAATVEQFRRVAAALEADGQPDEALGTLRQAASLHDYDNDLKAQLARAFIARNNLAMAAEYLTIETAGDDPGLLMTVADIQLRADKVDEGMTLLRRLLEEDSKRRESITLLGWSVAEQKPDAGFQVMELVADSAVAQQEWHEAIAALQEFVTRVPNHTPALMRLVEICVDGGLEAAMYSAQAQLADAYIAVGAANEARFIAEDLVAREPWEKANIDRFRRALVLLGEPDPDGLIAARLSGESPFTATDLSAFGGGSLFGDAPAVAAPAMQEEADLNALHLDVVVSDPFSSTESDTPRRSRPEEQRHFSLSEKGIDVLAILGPEPVAAPEPPPAPTGSEVDITLGLDLKPIPAPAPAPPPDLDGVFGSMREKAARRTGLDESEKEYKRGLALRKAGDIDGCIQALETASRAPKLRFATSRMIAKLYRDRNQLPQALEWLERASQAPAPTSDDAHQLKYEMAEALEKNGDVARALAVCTQLKAEAGDYRDVTERIDRLAKVQAG